MYWTGTSDSWQVIDWTVSTSGDYRLTVYNYANSLGPTEFTFVGVACS